ATPPVRGSAGSSSRCSASAARWGGAMSGTAPSRTSGGSATGIATPWPPRRPAPRVSQPAEHGWGRGGGGGLAAALPGPGPLAAPGGLVEDDLAQPDGLRGDLHALVLGDELQGLLQ